MTTARTGEMPKAYDPRAVEPALYEWWESRGYFRPRKEGDREPFTIIMPPPNVTGALHIGHALTAAIEDILIRWHRMLGDPTLWVPGTDHAGIATQNVVERELAKEGLSRHDLGREAFVERAWQWARIYRRRIDDQHRRLGVSCDWSRNTFTMDERPARGVRLTFVRWFEQGLIYRGERMINWCPRCMTALSDLEVNHQAVRGKLWFVRYPLVDDAGGDAGEHMTMATTRPETIPADVGVAVNPDDERYRGRVGRGVRIPFSGRIGVVVADEAIDRSFGTGALKVTPGHDPVDFEIGRRHGLPVVSVMNLDGTLNEAAGAFAGMDRFAARERVAVALAEQGLLDHVEDYETSVGTCHRCGTIVEPIVSLQWFVTMAPLAAPAIAAVREGKIRIIPERFEKVYFNWMENIRDWCISRQLWWGHRIPVWYCRACDGITGDDIPAAAAPIVAEDAPERCPRCGGGELVQDPDVLDTWFSSQLWPFTTLGWPDDTPDLRYFYPTGVMETGYDILFFWVARMIMSGIAMMGDVPFRTVYLHGLVRDPRGEKMSKTRGNVMDPLDLIARYGTDALRYTLATGSTPGNDMKLSTERLEAGRSFANKLWNAARYVIMQCGDGPVRRLEPADFDTLVEPEDRWIVSRLQRLVTSVDGLLGRLQIGEAGRQVHDFAWGEFCDWYIEMTKPRLRAGDRGALPVLVGVLEQVLRLLHPYMPFVTEELWGWLRPIVTPPLPEACIVAPFPSADGGWRDPAAERAVQALTDAVRAVRNVRAERQVEPAHFVPLELGVPDAEVRAIFERMAGAVESLARARPVSVLPAVDAGRTDAAVVVLSESTVALPLKGLVDLQAECERTARLLAEVAGEMGRQQAKLANEQFVRRAPAHLVEREREKLADAERRAEALRARRAELGCG